MKNIDAILDKISPVFEGKKAVIFDMDGTLVDSMEMWSHLDIEYMNRIGRTPNPDFHDKVCTLTIPLAAEYIYEIYNTEQTAKEIEEEFFNMAYEYYSKSIPLKPGVYELVKYLKENGYKLSVATANDIVMCEACLKRLGIYEDMDAVVNCDMVGATKAKPDVFDLACKLMGTTREESVIFEDSMHAISTAVGAGYTVVGIYEKSQAHRWQEVCESTYCQLVFE